MFDGTYVFDAGWVFFAAWSLILIAFFVIAFGEDLLNGSEARSNSAVKKPQNSMQSASSHLR